MRRNTIGGYQGPVEILSPTDDVLAQAACRYRAEEDASGADHWQGRLHRIEPPDAVAGGRYRLRFSGGRHGDISIAEPSPAARILHFDGIGSRPL